MYSTGKPRSRRAITICSDSAFLTRGSLAPCATSSGVLIFCAELSGDWRVELGLALRRRRVAHALVEEHGGPASQYGGIDSSSVMRLDGPTIDTAAA